MYVCFCRHHSHLPPIFGCHYQSLWPLQHFWDGLHGLHAQEPATYQHVRIDGCRIMQEDDADHPSDWNTYQQEWLWRKMIDTFLFGSIGTQCLAVADWLLEGLLHTFEKNWCWKSTRCCLCERMKFFIWRIIPLSPVDPSGIWWESTSKSAASGTVPQGHWDVVSTCWCLAEPPGMWQRDNSWRSLGLLGPFKAI